MILFFNQDIDRFKPLYYIILIITGFLLATKIPQFVLDANLIILLSSVLIIGVIPLKFGKQFDFALNSGFVFITVLKFGLDKTVLPLLAILFLSYILKLNRKNTIKKTVYISGFNTILIVLTNILGMLFYNLIRGLMPTFISVFLPWLLVISINIGIIYIYRKTYKSKFNFMDKNNIYFGILSAFIYAIAFIGLHILLKYGTSFYIIYIVAIILFFLYLRTIQINNKAISVFLESLEKVNKINLKNENGDLKEFTIRFYNKLSEYIPLSCISLTEKSEQNNSIVYCKNIDEKKTVINGIKELNKNKRRSGIITIKGEPDKYSISYELEMSDNRKLFISYLDNNINTLKENRIFFDLLRKKIEIIIENIDLYDKAKVEFLKTVEMIIAMIEAKDKLTAGHSIRVAKYSYLIGQELGLKKKELDDLKFAALLHDIGKIAIPENILNKKAELTEEEFEIMKRHPIIGAELINTIDSLKDSIPGIIEHHERYDGNGYPKGLKGEEISLQGRIVAIADAFDAVTSNRVYRYAIKRIDAIAMIIAGSYSRFDPNLVEVFAEIIKRYEGKYIDEDILKFVEI